MATIPTVDTLIARGFDIIAYRRAVRTHDHDSIWMLHPYNYVTESEQDALEAQAKSPYNPVLAVMDAVDHYGVNDPRLTLTREAIEWAEYAAHGSSPGTHHALFRSVLNRMSDPVSDAER